MSFFDKGKSFYNRAASSKRARDSEIVFVSTPRSER